MGGTAVHGLLVTNLKAESNAYSNALGNFVRFTSNLYTLKAGSGSTHVLISLILLPGLYMAGDQYIFIECLDFKINFGIFLTLYP